MCWFSLNGLAQLPVSDSMLTNAFLQEGVSIICFQSHVEQAAFFPRRTYWAVGQLMVLGVHRQLSQHRGGLASATHGAQPPHISTCLLLLQSLVSNLGCVLGNEPQLL